MEIAREMVVPLIRGHNYSLDITTLEDNSYCPLEFCANSVNLAEEMKADPSCLRTKAISEYLEYRSQKRFHFLSYGIYSDTGDCFELSEDFAREACRLLPDPFIRIQILKPTKSNQQRSLFVDDFQLHALLMTSTCILWLDHRYYRQCMSFTGGIMGERRVLRVSLGWKEPVKIQLLETHSLLGKMLQDESTMDLTIVAGNGAELKCHLQLFAAHSPVFSAMVSAKTGMKEAVSKRVELKENSEVGLRHLVRYLYGVELSAGEMASDTALELFQVAHKYGLSQLETSLGQLFLCMKEMEWFTPDVALELYLFVKNVDGFEKLKEHSLALMASISADDLRSCELFKELDKTESVDLSRKLGHSQKPTRRNKRAKLN